MNLLQKIVITGNYNQPSNMFYRGNLQLIGDICEINEKVSFDTYFNLFNLKKWITYCALKKLRFSISICGIGKVQLLSINKEKKISTISESDYNSEKFEKIEICYDVKEKTTENFLFVKIIPVKKTQFKDAFFYNFEKCNDIRLACCFCTYKREKELIQNVNMINAHIIRKLETSTSEDLIDICVVDNALTLEDNFNSEQIKVFKNKNLGGAAGFTRGIIETCIKKNLYDYIILMDDDACVEPFVIEKTLYILKNLKKSFQESMIGGALLSKERMELQLENGAYFNSGKAFKRKQYYDLSEYTNVIDNENEENINYCGWFYACIPTSFINEENLPLPIFIHGDDQEYGLRFKGKIITMNGICIWHPNPSATLRSYMSYYDSRNSAIIMSELYEKMNKIQAIKLIAKHTFPNILLYRYEAAFHSLNGFVDFYKGIDWLKQIDAEKLNARLLKEKMYRITKLTGTIRNESYNLPCNMASRERRYKRILNYLVPTYNKEKKYSVEVSSGEIELFGTKTIKLVNQNTNEEYIFTKSYLKLFMTMFKFLEVCYIVLRNHKKIWKEWNCRIHEIKTYEFWKKYLRCEKVE